MADTRTRLPLPEPDITSTQIDSVMRTYTVRSHSAKQMHAYSDAENAALLKQLRAAKAIIHGQDERALHMAREHGELMQRASDVAGERAANAILTDENVALMAEVAAWIKENGPGGWIDALRERVKVLEDALRKLLMGEEADLTLEIYAAAAEHARVVLAARKAAP